MTYVSAHQTQMILSAAEAVLWLTSHSELLLLLKERTGFGGRPGERGNAASCGAKRGNWC